MSAVAQGEQRLTIPELNALGEVAAYEALLRCCGSRAWASSVVADRPFKDLQALISSGERAWQHATVQEKLEAFSHHPRIGDGEAFKARMSARFEATASWAAGEQKGVAGASDEVLSELARLNREYEMRFPHVFLICATGKSAAEMLASLKARILNTPEEELDVAAAEQAKITKLRLEKLIK